MGIATWSLRFAANVLPFTVVADARVFLFAMALPIAVTILAGFAPAWRATGTDVLSGLRPGAAGGAMPVARLRRAVVLGQMTLSVLLLAVAGLLVRGVTSLGSAVGPLQEDALAVSLSFRDLGFEPEAARQIRLSLTDAVDGLSGVEETAVSSSGLFGFSTSLCASGSGLENTFAAADVSAGFFRALGVRVRQGRVFHAGDREGVVIVNEAFAARLPPGTGALGSTVQLRQNVGDPGWRRAEIVGVVEDSYERVPRGRARPRCYLPLIFLERRLVHPVRAIAVGGCADATGAGGRRGDPSRPVRPGDRHRGRPRARGYRWLYWVTEILAAVSALALGLAAVGLFGLIRTPCRSGRASSACGSRSARILEPSRPA